MPMKSSFFIFIYRLSSKVAHELMGHRFRRLDLVYSLGIAWMVDTKLGLLARQIDEDDADTEE
jgi:hypothetical protein